MKKAKFFSALSLLTLAFCAGYTQLSPPQVPTDIAALPHAQARVSATVSGTQKVTFQSISIGDITVDENLCTNDAFLIKGMGKLEAHSNNSAGYKVELRSDDITTNGEFLLKEEGGDNKIRFTLCDADANGESIGPAPASLYRAGDPVINENTENVKLMSKNLRPVMEGNQFKTISEGTYSTYVTAVLINY